MSQQSTSTNSASMQKTYNFSSFSRIMQKQQEEITKLLQTPLTHVSRETDLKEDFLFQGFKANNSFLTFTGFTEMEILDIYRDMQRLQPKFTKRGTRPSVSTLDSLVLYMALFKSGVDYKKLSHDFQIKTSTMQAAIERIRPLLWETLECRWLRNRLRPEPLVNTNFPFIALATDVVSVRIPHPKLPFSDARVFFDGKNKKYALKKECAVRTCAPYYCLFVQKARVGSDHDYAILKDTFPSYLPYLQKLTHERALLSTDFENRSWGMVCDSGYIGPASDTPNLRRLVIPKPSSNIGEITQSTELAKIRVVVEQFFGRFYMLWNMFRKYRYSQSTFDTDFNICALLTNEHIKRMDTTEIDKRFYDSLLEADVRAFEEKERKRKASYEKSKNNKRKRFMVEDLISEAIHSCEVNLG